MRSFKRIRFSLKKSPKKRARRSDSYKRLNFMLRRCGMHPRKIPLVIGQKYRIQHLLGSGSFGCIFSALHVESYIEYAVKFEHVKARFPQLLFEKRIYGLFHKRASSFEKRNYQPGSLPSTSTNPSSTDVMSKLSAGGSTVSSRSSGSSSDNWISGIFDYGDLSRFLDRKGRLIGVPKVHFFGSIKNYNVMVMDRLGPNLEDLFSFCHRKFSLKTVLMLADQLISRMEFVHSQHFIHRDIKPENFLMGVEDHGYCCFVVDFGLAKKYINDKTRRHIRMRKGKPLTGTARYTSINSHLGIEQSRRDDLESLGYMLVYFAKGALPWQGLKAENKDQRYEKIFTKKMSTSIESLCKSLPHEFVKYFQYVGRLKFHEKPDYDYLRSLFMNLFKKMKFKQDLVFDWVLLKKQLFSEDKVHQYLSGT